MGFWFFMTQFMQGVMGYSPRGTGLGFLPMTLANFATALTAGTGMLVLALAVVVALIVRPRRVVPAGADAAGRERVRA